MSAYDCYAASCHFERLALYKRKSPPTADETTGRVLLLISCELRKIFQRNDKSEAFEFSFPEIRFLSETFVLVRSVFDRVWSLNVVSSKE